MINRKSLTRRILPVVVSFGLLGWLISWVSPLELIQAAAELNWVLLLPATGAMVLGLYLWDALCLPVVYRVDGRRWGYRQALHLRGLSYLGGALHYEVGQAALAWAVARLQNAGLVRMLTRSVLLAYHDIVVLLAIGMVGAMLSTDARIERIRPFVATGLVLTIGLAVICWAVPTQWWAKLRRKQSGGVLEDWSLNRSLKLVPLRVCYFGILVIYAAVALHICRMPVDHQVVMSTTPLVLLADGLPSISGLGTRETALQLLLKPDRPEVLLAMSLIWSAGLMIGRAAIGLAHLWGQQWFYGAAVEKPLQGS